MAAKQDHEPHILRPHLQEWCGGTEPPTMITATQIDEIRVDIFAESVDIHDGYIHAPTEARIFLINNSNLTPGMVDMFALRALMGRGNK